MRMLGRLIANNSVNNLRFLIIRKVKVEMHGSIEAGAREARYLTIFETYSSQMNIWSLHII